MRNIALMCALALFFQISAQNEITFSPTDDAFIQGGSNANTNFGTDERLRVKQENNDEYTRVSYIKFDLRSLDDNVSAATLELTIGAAGPTWDGNIIQINSSANTWDENTITFNNAPTPTTPSVSTVCSGNVLQINIKTLVDNSLTSDSILSIAINKSVGGADDWVNFRSKEYSNASQHPKLIINGAQQVSDVLIYPVENQIDWSNAGMDYPIPAYNNIIDVTLQGAVGNGSTDNASVVQNLINNSTAGTVLFFPTGTYRFESTLSLSDSIVIRGECVTNTKFEFDLNGAAQPSIWFRKQITTSESTITSGFEKGSTSLQVTDPSAFAIGDFIEVYQDNDPTLMYTNPTWDVSWAQNVVGQMIRITDISGNTIELERTLYYDFSQNLNFRAIGAQMISGAGLENLHIERLDNGNDYSIRFKYADNCWVRNIESSLADRGHVEISQSANIEIRDSYFHHSHDYGGGGHGYGVNLQDHATDVLIENNIFHYLRHTFLAKEGSIGNVFAYNYSREPNGSANDIALHGHFGLMNLMESNIVQKIIAGDYWGPSGPGNTYYRNRVESDDIVMDDATHAQNIMANEIINGTVSIDASVDDTWQHSNFNSNGMIEAPYNIDLPSSLYLDAAPDFLSGYSFPPIGPEFSINQNTIPAKQRWDDNEPVECLDLGVLTSSLAIDQSNDWLIFPNPSDGIITVTQNLQPTMNFQVLNNEGRIVKQGQMQKTLEIDLSQLPAGVYHFVSIGTETTIQQTFILK